MDLQEQFGRRLAEIRESRGLTMFQLAKRVGLTAQFIGRLEIGTRAPSFKVMARLAKILDADPADFFRDQDRPVSVEGRAPEPLAQAYLRGAAARLSPADLDLVLSFVRRLSRP